MHISCEVDVGVGSSGTPGAERWFGVVWLRFRFGFLFCRILIFLVLLLVSFLFGQVFDRVKLTPNTLCGGGQPCANTANFIFQFHPESARVDRLASSELSLASILAVEAAVVFLFQFSQAM
jgi:hypothetical protein